MSTKAEIPVQTGFVEEVQSGSKPLTTSSLPKVRSRAPSCSRRLRQRAREAGITTAGELTTPYLNTIPKHEEVPYPGDRDLERRIKSLIRWNAMAMVHRQNKKDAGIGGHISHLLVAGHAARSRLQSFLPRDATATSRATSFTSRATPRPASTRAPFSKAASTKQQLQNFRHELRDAPGLSSYPHPWLMPDFWRFPTVSMGLGPLNAIYQARFMRYLENREPDPEDSAQGLGVPRRRRDGRSRHPGRAHAGLARKARQPDLRRQLQSAAARRPGARQQGIIEELEGVFRGAGWNVIKVIWGSDWDKLFARDNTGLLLKRMDECVDGEYQAFKAKGGAYIRKEFFGKYPELLELVSDMTDEQIWHAAPRRPRSARRSTTPTSAPSEHKGGPTVILAKTVKGYGLGSTQARNATHQEKKLTDEALTAFVKRFDIPIPDDAGQEGQALSPAGRQPRDRLHAGAPRRRWAATCPARDVPELELQGAAARLLRGVARRLEGPRSLHHHGLRQHSAPPA